MCFRPELLDTIGYLSEETYGADGELCIRINNYTKWNTGIASTDFISVEQPQDIFCTECKYKECSGYIDKREIPMCVNKYKQRNMTLTSEFKNMKIKKLDIYYKELREGKREVYCASVHDEDSLRKHYYNREWAEENFNYFIKNSNES